ncbi:hypothetical protein ACHAXT_007733 [Thalassiosira profunda]
MHHRQDSKANGKVAMPSESKEDGSRSGGRHYFLLTAILSGAVCYRLGMFAGCASNMWQAGDAAADSSFLAPMRALENDGDPDSPEYYGRERPTASQLPADYGASRRKSIAIGPDDRRRVSRATAPYDCGVVFFYHIPCTGGASINQWLRKYKKPEFGNVSYYQYWELETRNDGSFNPNPERCEAHFYEGMQQHLSNLGPNEWRIAHSHLTNQYLNESEDVLYKWRSQVEAQGCQLINTIMLRDPLNHAMSLYKIVLAKNSTREEWTEYLASPTGPGKWATVLDFFLYNNQGLRYREDYPNGPGGRNPYSVSKEEKVRRAMEILHRHFDVVTLDHATFQSQILKWTGLTPLKMPYGNVHRAEMKFTKKEVETLQKLLRNNGDLDFVDRVKLEYHDHLSYMAD